MSNNSIKHHTIPQFYLNCFANKIKKGYKIKGYRINVYNKNTLCKFSELVKNVGYIKHFNTIKINGEESDIFEKLHNEVYEKKFSNIFKNLIKKIERYNQIINFCYNCMSNEYYNSKEFKCLEYEDKQYISYLLAYFIYRSRKLRNVEEIIFEKQQLILNDIYRAKGFTNKNVIKTKIEEQLGTKEELKKGQLISLFKGKGIYELYKILYNHEWIIYYNNTNKLLYTSDNGHALSTVKKNQRSIGYNTYGNIIMFPINPRICIIMYDRRISKEITDMSFMNLSTYQVKMINYQIVIDGIDEIYSKDGNWDDLIECYKKYKILKGQKPYGVY